MSQAPSPTAAHLERTALLDFDHPAIAELLRKRQWPTLAPYERIGAIYDFVRNDIAFGYNRADDIPASQVLADGMGQCNTKATLLMALLRASGTPCRFHGFTIDKKLQHGAVTGLAYWLAPRSIIHSWVEVWFDDQWLPLEGLILDQPYLQAVQRRFPDATSLCGYGVATAALHTPAVQWCGSATYIQRDGINADLGLFDCPDDFYRQFGANLSGVKRWVFQHVVRHQMNRNVARVRANDWSGPAAGPAGPGRPS